MECFGVPIDGLIRIPEYFDIVMGYVNMLNGEVMLHEVETIGPYVSHDACEAARQMVEVSPIEEGVFERTTECYNK